MEPTLEERLLRHLEHREMCLESDLTHYQYEENLDEDDRVIKNADELAWGSQKGLNEIKLMLEKFFPDRTP